jgi:endonuclease YncB( thermonuclease family)
VTNDNPQGIKINQMLVNEGLAQVDSNSKANNNYRVDETE